MTMPGMSRSCDASVSIVSWKNTPVFGPPLWSWPVECRKRGPKPTVVATLQRVANVGADVVQLELVFSVVLEVGGERDVVAGLYLAQNCGDGGVEVGAEVHVFASPRAE